MLSDAAKVGEEKRLGRAMLLQVSPLSIHSSRYRVAACYGRLQLIMAIQRVVVRAGWWPAPGEPAQHDRCGVMQLYWEKGKRPV
jgi:hypothetical protein